MATFFDERMNLLFLKLGIFVAMAISVWYTAGSNGIAIMCPTILATMALTTKGDY